MTESSSSDKSLPSDKDLAGMIRLRRRRNKHMHLQILDQHPKAVQGSLGRAVRFTWTINAVTVQVKYYFTSPVIRLTFLIRCVKAQRFCPSSVREGHTNRYKTEQSKRTVFLYFLAFSCLALYHV